MKMNTDNTEIKRRSTFAILFYINRTKIRKDKTCQLLCKISTYKEQSWIYHGRASEECRDGRRPKAPYTSGSFQGA